MRIVSCIVHSGSDSDTTADQNSLRSRWRLHDLQGPDYELIVLQRVYKFAETRRVYCQVPRHPRVCTVHGPLHVGQRNGLVGRVLPVHKHDRIRPRDDACRGGLLRVLEQASAAAVAAVRTRRRGRVVLQVVEHWHYALAIWTEPLHVPLQPAQKLVADLCESVFLRYLLVKPAKRRL